MRSIPLAIVGLGLTGEVYAQRLIDAGLPVIGFDIDPAPPRAAGRHRRRAVASIAELAAPARGILIAVFNTAQVEDVIENHLLPALGEGSGKIVVVMSTCDPDQVAALAARVIPRGIRYLDVPVSAPATRCGAATAWR